MPEDLYKVGPAEARHFDEIGLRALHLFGGNPGQAREYTMYFFEKRQPVTPILLSPDPQMALALDIRG